MSGWFSEPHAGSSGQEWAERHRVAGPTVGLILIALGALFLVQQATGVDVWHWAWPFAVIVPGLLFFAGMFSGGKGASGLAVPASIVTTTGLILLFQNTFHLWQTWAYAWALIAPTSVGVGIWLSGWWSDQLEPRRVGRRMVEIGLVLFLGFAAFFEILLNLSGLMRLGGGGIVIAVLLILAGVYLLSQREGKGGGGF